MKKKILFIHEKLGFQGGAEQNIAFLTSHLQKKYDLSLVYEICTGQNEEGFAAPFSRVQNSFPIKDLHPDVIFVHKCRSLPLIKQILDSGIPCVRMVHDHETYCMRSYKYFPWNRKTCDRKAGLSCLFPCGAFIKRDRTSRLGVSLASYSEQMDLIRTDQRFDRFIVASTYMQKELTVQGYEPLRIVTIPPVPAAKGECIDRFSNDNTLLFSGQIIRGKGLDLLIESLAYVRPPFKLIVCGSGSHEPHCRQIASKLNLNKQISFRGFLSHEELHHVYQGASLGVVPSVWPEPFGAVGVEFMRLGLPVVGFDSGGISDWLINGKTGLLVPNMDVKALGKSIDSLLQNKDRAESLGNAAKAFVNSSFSAERSLLLTEDLLEQLF